VTAATVKRLDPTQVELEISISDEELDAARERAFRQLVRNAKIPGFRPGKAPRKVFEAAYGTDLIQERAMEAVVPDAYSRALRENELDPVDQPQMELLPEEEGQPLRLRATVSVRPEIVLGEYKGVALEGPALAVGEAEIDRSLEALQRDAVTYVPVERPAQLGDMATLDYEGRVDGVAFEGGKAEQQPTELVAERFIPGFADGIVGMSAGEHKAIEATFPDEYSNTELAGKKAVFEVTLHEVKVPEYPPVGDEFAKRFHPEGGLPELRDDLRGRLETTAKTRSRRVLTGALVEKLVGTHAFDLPAVMVERETAALLVEAKDYVARAGLDWNAYLAGQNKTEDELRADYVGEAERRVKSTLLLEAIAKAEKIEANQTDVENEIASLSRQYGQPRQAILEMLQPNFNALVDGIVRSKTIEFLLDHAKITESASAAETPGSEAAASEETNAAPAQS
jgi:trigger factor